MTAPTSAATPPGSPTPRSCCTSRPTGSGRTASASRATRWSSGPTAGPRTARARSPAGYPVQRGVRRRRTGLHDPHRRADHQHPHRPLRGDQLRRLQGDGQRRQRGQGLRARGGQRRRRPHPPAGGHLQGQRQPGPGLRARAARHRRPDRRHRPDEAPAGLHLGDDQEGGLGRHPGQPGAALPVPRRRHQVADDRHRLRPPQGARLARVVAEEHRPGQHPVHHRAQPALPRADPNRLQIAPEAASLWRKIRFDRRSASSAPTPSPRATTKPGEKPEPVGASAGGSPSPSPSQRRQARPRPAQAGGARRPVCARDRHPPDGARARPGCCYRFVIGV